MSKMLSLQALLLLLTPALGLPTIGVNAPAVEIDGVMKRASAPKTMSMYHHNCLGQVTALT